MNWLICSDERYDGLLRSPAASPERLHRGRRHHSPLPRFLGAVYRCNSVFGSRGDREAHMEHQIVKENWDGTPTLGLDRT